MGNHCARLSTNCVPNRRGSECSADKQCTPREVGLPRAPCKACALHRMQLLRDSAFRAGIKLGLSIAKHSGSSEEEATATVVQYPDAKLDCLVKEQWLAPASEGSHDPNLVSLP